MRISVRSSLSIVLRFRFSFNLYSSICSCFSKTAYSSRSFFFFFLNDRAPPEISPLPLPAALPISPQPEPRRRRIAGRPRAVSDLHRHEGDGRGAARGRRRIRGEEPPPGLRGAVHRHRQPALLDRKSTRLNSSH